jgi:GNAT superfamily N-acetyltransferase
MPIDKTILEEYIATANSGKYKSMAEVHSKFPELKDFSPDLMEEYVATANSGKYKTIDEVNLKFPEFSDTSKKKASLPNFSQNLGDFTTPLQSGVQKPLDYKLPSPSKSVKPIDVGRPKNLAEFNKLYGTNYANIVTGEQVNPFTANIKTIEANKPLTAVEVMQKNNQVALERLEVKKAKIEKLKALKELKLQEPQLTQKAQELQEVIKNETLPYESRVTAQNELKGIADIFDNASLEVDQLNELNEIDKTLTNRINSNETIRQKRLESEYNGFQNLVQSTEKALVKLPAQLANMSYAVMELGESITQPELATAKKQLLREALKPIEDFADGLTTQEIPENYKDWFSGKMSGGKLAYLASEAIGQTLPTVAAGFLTGGFGAVATGSAMAFDESRNILLGAGLSQNQADAGALGLAVPLGLLEKYGISDIIAKPIGKKILAETAQEVIQKLGKELTETSAEEIFKLTKKSLGTTIKKYSAEVLGAAWKEPVTEMSQALVNELGKQAAEAYTGQDSNADQTTLDYLKETGKSILSEGLSGALGGVGISAVTSAFQSRTNPSAYDRALELKDQDLFEDFIAQMQSEVDKGILTPEQMELATANVKKIQEVDAKIPKNIVGAERRSAAASLIAKKEELEAEADGKDKTLAAPILEEVKIIDQTLGEIAQGLPIEEIENGLNAQIEENKNETPLSEVKTIEEAKVETPKTPTTTTTPSSDISGEVSALGSVEQTQPALRDVESTAKEFTVEEDNKIKDIAIQANTKVGNYVKSVPTGRKDRFANNINEFETTNPFTNEKKTFKKQSEATEYVINEIAKANTKKGREEIFQSLLSKQLTNKQNEKANTKENNEEPMLGGLPTNRDETKGGETSAELYAQTEKEVADLRAKEQAEYDAMSDPNDVAKRNEIYDRYDKLITPLIREQRASEPSKSDKNYQEAQEANSIIAKENPQASVLLTPKGNDLSLTAVYVGKDKRGKGIGSKVLESVKKQADKLGKKVVLDATNELDAETDLERLGKFYEKNGFEKVGENKYEYNPKEKAKSKTTTLQKEQESKPIALPKENDLVTLEVPNRMPKKMVFKDGVWKQKVGNEFTEVGKQDQEAAQAKFDEQNKTQSENGKDQNQNEGTRNEPIKTNGQEVRNNGNDVIGQRSRSESEKDASRNEAKNKVSKDETNTSLKTANEYNETVGLPKIAKHDFKPSDKQVQSEIGKVYEQLQDVTSPNYKETELERSVFEGYKAKYPELFKKFDIKNYKDLVIKSYEQLSKEVEAQFNALPIKIEFHIGDKNYESSVEMLDDVHNFGHLWVFKGGDDHPLTGSKTIDKNGNTINDKFRAVHDYFGHSVNGYQFGKDGEENAWIEHSKMFSPLAQLALSSETRGQNSVVNYSGVNDVALEKMKRAAAYLKKGLAENNAEMIAESKLLLDEANAEFQYADQKAIILPQEYTNASQYFKEAKPTTEEKVAKADKSIEDIIDILDNLKIDLNNKMLGVIPPFNLIPLVWNGSITVLQTSIKAGRAIKDAIQDAIDYIKSKNPTDFNEEAFRKYFNDKLGTNKAKVKEAVSTTEAAIVKDPILKRINKAFLKIGTEILDNAEALMAKAKELASGGKQVQYNITMTDGSQKQVKPIDVDVVNGFYSPLEKVINEAKQDKMPAKQWIDKFAKGEEAKWTGLSDWLTQQVGSVSKADIQQYLKDNRISIVEVVKGDRSTTLTKDDFKATNNELGVVAEGNGYTIEKSDNQNRSNPYDLYYDGEYIQENKSIDDAIDRAIRDSRNRKATPESGVKFQNYQLEGQKENYKEVLVTIPKKVGKGTVEQNEDGTFSIRKTDGTLTSKKWGSFDAADSYNERATQSIATDFKSSHFDEPNILVHLRMNTRTDAQGNKVLFLEEVQSDWGQKGKKEGFSLTSEEKSKLIEEHRGVLAELQDIDAKIIEAVDNKNIGKNIFQLTERKQELLDLSEKLKDQIFRNKAPQAPFVTDTNAWTKLGLKVALKEAVAQGADKIAWTTGEQQNDRYSLEKIADEVRYSKNADGTYKIIAYKDGENVSENKRLNEKDLESNFGKDVAQRIIDGVGENIEGEKSLTGENLKVGGKGMKGFYGSPTEGSLGIVGNVAKSLFKQEPKTVGIVKGKQTDQIVNQGWTRISDNEVEGYISTKDGSVNEKKTFDTPNQAKLWIKDRLNELSEEKNISTQHSIDITPELKASMEQGQPLFQLNDKGEILGFTHNGKIYLNGEKITANTTMEEAGHIWINWAKENRTDLYTEGLKKVLGSVYLKEVEANKNYQAEALKQGKKGSEAYNTYMQEEALAKAIADNGAKFVTETRKASFKEWVNAMWKEVVKAFGIQNLTPNQVKKLTLEEFAKMAAADVFSKKETTQPKGSVVDEIKERISEADKQGTDKSKLILRYDNLIVSPARFKELLDDRNLTKDTLTNAQSLKDGQAILEKLGVTEAINQVNSGKIDGAAAVAAMMIIIRNAKIESVKLLEQGKDLEAEEYFQLSIDALDAAQELIRESARATQAANLLTTFVLDTPELAVYYFAKKIEKENNKIKNQRETKENAKEVVNIVNNTVKKATKEVAAKISVDLEKQALKEFRDGIGRNATAEKKAKAKERFDKIRDMFKSNNQAFSSIIPISPKLMIKFVDLVESFYMGGIDLQAAINRAKAQLTREKTANKEEGATPQELAEMEKQFKGVVEEETKPKPKTEAQLEREAASKEYADAKKEYNKKIKEQKDLADRIEKQEKKVAALKEKEAQAQRDRIDATELQRIQMAAKEVQKEIEATKKQEIAEKRDLSARILKQEQKVAALKAKEQEAIDNANAKRNLDNALAQQKAFKEEQKQQDKDIKEFVTKIIKQAKGAKKIELLIESFYSQPKEQQLQANLEQMVIDALGVTPRKATEIATEIKKGIETKIRAELTKKMGLSIADPKSKEVEQAKKDLLDGKKTLVDKFLEKLTLTNKNKTFGIIDEMLKLSMMDVLNEQDIMDLVKHKYGIVDFTQEDAQYIESQAKKVNEATTQDRKNLEAAKLANRMVEKSPLYYNEAANSLFYAAVLSGVGTQDVNFSANLNIAANLMVDTALVNFFDKTLRKENLTAKGLRNNFINFFSDALYSLGRTYLQDGLGKGAKSLLQVPSKSTISSLFFGVKRGTESFSSAEFAIESQKQSETDYGRFKPRTKVFNAIHKLLVKLYFNKTKYVGRLLSSVDVAMQELILNPQLPVMIREVLQSEGYSNEQINEMIRYQLTNTVDEIELAREKAVDEILKYDTKIIDKNGKFIFYYFNKPKFTAATQAEAEVKAREFVEKQRVDVSRWAKTFLQQKINETALKSARNLAQEGIMSAPPQGSWERSVYDFIMKWKLDFEKKAKEADQKAALSNKIKDRIGYNAMAKLNYALSNTVMFAKVMVNLISVFGVKATPLGLIRAANIQYKINKYKKDPTYEKGQKLSEFYLTKAQLSQQYIQAVVPMILYFTTVTINSLFGDDDDEKIKLTDEEQLELDNTRRTLKEQFNVEYDVEASDNNPLLKIPKNGEMFGSLDFLPKNIVKSLEESGLAKAFHEYRGVYPNGKFVPIYSDPRKFNLFNATMYTYSSLIKYKYNNKDIPETMAQKAAQVTAITVDAAFYAAISFSDLSIFRKGKDIAEQLRDDELLNAIIGTSEKFFPELAIANPNLLKQGIAYVDGKARRFLTPAENPKLYIASKVPILGSFVAVYGSDQRYGMFGEEMYRIPATKQGGLSQTLSEYLFSEKNKPQREMYQYLALKGFNKIKAMPTTLTFNDEPISDIDRSRLGAIAGRKVFERLTKEKPMLDNMSNKLTAKYVDRLFNMEFLNAFMLDKKLFTQKDVDLAEKKFAEKAEKDVKKEAVINTFIENNKIDKSEVRMYQKLTEKGQAKEQINKIAEKINNTPPLTNRSGFENVDINDSDLAKLIAFKRLEKVEYASGNKKYFTTSETKKDLFSKIVFDNKNITIEDAQGNYDTYLFVNGNPFVIKSK